MSVGYDCEKFPVEKVLKILWTAAHPETTDTVKQVALSRLGLLMQKSSIDYVDLARGFTKVFNDKLWEASDEEEFVRVIDIISRGTEAADTDDNTKLRKQLGQSQERCKLLTQQVTELLRQVDVLKEQVDTAQPTAAPIHGRPVDGNVSFSEFRQSLIHRLGNLEHGWRQAHIDIMARRSGEAKIRIENKLNLWRRVGQLPFAEMIGIENITDEDVAAYRGKKVRWAPNHHTYLRDLCAWQDPITGKRHTNETLAQKMNERFGFDLNENSIKGKKHALEHGRLKFSD